MDEKELATATYIMDMKETQFELISIISSTNVCILELKKTYIYYGNENSSHIKKEIVTRK
jgi:hypothetical protein